MPRTGITAYDLLISCPGDVIEEIKIIKNVVQDFNRMFGAINNIEISLKHWSTDSYPQMGDKPQEVLNKQFIRECDAAVAVFWTRFGTPTDKYQSGSEEEIEELIKMGKQVFLYFLDKPINPSTVDMSQYEKVRQFMESCKSKGLYAVVGSEEELKKQLLNHLSLYFLNLITGKADEPLPKEKPCLQLRNVNDMSTEFLTVNSFSLIDSAFMKNKEIEINNLYKSAQNLSLPERKPKMIKNETGYENVMKSVTSQFSSLGISQKNLTDADLGNDQKNTIETFFFKKKVLIVPEFWNVGELKKQLVVFRTPFGNNRPSYEGSDNEKQKYDLLVNLYWKIKEFNEYEEYLSILDH